MLTVCFCVIVVSIFTKIVFDGWIDDYLRENGYKSFAKKRKLAKAITHSDVKGMVHKRFIIYNYAIYGICLLTVLLTVVSFFVSEQTEYLFVRISCFFIFIELLVTVLRRYNELLFGERTGRWKKFLLVAATLALIVIIFAV